MTEGIATAVDRVPLRDLPSVEPETVPPISRVYIFKDFRVIKGGCCAHEETLTHNRGRGGKMRCDLRHKTGGSSAIPPYPPPAQRGRARGRVLGPADSEATTGSTCVPDRGRL